MLVRAHKSSSCHQLIVKSAIAAINFYGEENPAMAWFD